LPEAADELPSERYSSQARSAHTFGCSSGLLPEGRRGITARQHSCSMLSSSSGAAKGRGAAVILSHNHPSGNSAPSDNDIDITKRLFKAANILGIHVLDHIIVTPADYFSFMENGLVFQRQIE